MKCEHNPYYYPERSNLEIFVDIDTAGSYEFEMLIVWRHLKDGTLWYATDSGCSCPTPFEGYEGEGAMKLIPLTLSSLYSFHEEVLHFPNIKREDITLIIDKVGNYLSKNEQT